MISKYTITFKDSVVIYTLTSIDNSILPFRILSGEQMELLNLMLLDTPNPVFSCSEKQFYSRLTLQALERYKIIKENEFILKKMPYYGDI